MPQPLPTEKDPQAAHVARVEAYAARLAAAGVNLDLAKIEAAKAGTLRPVDENATANACPQCGGVGSVKINPDADYTDKAFGKMMLCPHSTHYPERQAHLVRLSNLSLEQLAIRLAHCREYNRPDEMADINGRPTPRSNLKMLREYRGLVENPYQHPFVYTWGPWGGGKTFASIALINEINEARRGPAMFIAWQDLLSWIKASFDDRNRVGEFGDWSDEQRYALLVAVPFLVVDEFDFSDSKTAMSEWNLSLMQRWLNARYLAGIDGRATTLFISNDSPESLGLGGVISRLDDKRNLKILNTAPDFRKAQKGK